MLFAVICILTLPLCFSTSRSITQTSLGSFGTTAYAGHTLTGEWCGCGGNNCICDPGEMPGIINAPKSYNKIEKPELEGASPVRSHSLSGLDFGAGVMMLALAFFVWARLRA